MKLISLNVGLPKLVLNHGEPVSTGIYKHPVTKRIALRKLNLEGDRQADLSVHGGPYKAVYGYPSEHYEFWKSEFPGMDLPWGMFGENFTTEGMFEDELNIGDKFKVGTATVMVTQPRLPCYKLGIKFGRADILRRFLQSGRTGFYFSVVDEAEVGVGDQLDLLEKSPHGVRVRDITRLYLSATVDPNLLRRAIAVEALPESWRVYFQERLETLNES
jgi:MOSC domain-containing protein YiiM